MEADTRPDKMSGLDNQRTRLSTVASDPLLCAICGELGPDRECHPCAQHPALAYEWVHSDCLREWEDAANDEICAELQARGFRAYNDQAQVSSEAR